MYCSLFFFFHGTRLWFNQRRWSWCHQHVSPIELTMTPVGSDHPVNHDREWKITHLDFPFICQAASKCVSTFTLSFSDSHGEVLNRPGKPFNKPTENTLCLSLPASWLAAANDRKLLKECLPQLCWRHSSCDAFVLVSFFQFFCLFLFPGIFSRHFFFFWVLWTFFFFFNALVPDATSRCKSQAFPPEQTKIDKKWQQTRRKPWHFTCVWAG